MDMESTKSGLNGPKKKVRFWRILIKKKSRLRETSNLSTDADSSTNTTVGWTKNTQNQKK